MSKHTPGPWNLCCGAVYRDAGKDPQVPIAFMCRDERATQAGIYPVERDANAALIAAAPDMAEALDDARETFEALYAFQPIWGREMVEHCLFTISAALERAGLGES